MLQSISMLALCCVPASFNVPILFQFCHASGSRKYATKLRCLPITSNVTYIAKMLSFSFNFSNLVQLRIVSLALF